MKNANTLSAFIKSTSIPAKLVRATVRQFGGWEAFQEAAQDIARSGADAGWVGFTYYHDTLAFTKRNRYETLAYAIQMADDLGESSAHAMIAGFNCLKMKPDEVAEAMHNHRSENRATVYNALAWFALEEVARAYADHA